MDYALLAAGTLSDLLSQVGSLIAFAVVMGAIVIAYVYLFDWGERKIAARIQSRHGPTHTGKFGLLQGAADMIKLMAKENIMPHGAENPLFVLIMPMLFSLFVIIIAFIPLTGTFVGIETTYGLLVVFAMIALVPLLMFLLGWASGNKFSEISAQRAVMTLMSYEIPLLLVVISVALAAGSYSISAIVAAQHSYWYVFAMPLGFVVAFVAMLAAMEIPPFDIEESEGELVSGNFTDLGAHYYALARLFGYMRIFIGVMLMALLFFGGWLGFSKAPFLSLMIKVVLLSVPIMVIRVISVRMRIDRIIKLGWIYLMPLAIVNLLIAFFLFSR